MSLGRPAVTIPQGFEEEVRKWKSGEQTATATMQALNLKRTTFYKLVKEVIV